jgi:hypothetical protein
MRVNRFRGGKLRRTLLGVCGSFGLAVKNLRRLLHGPLFACTLSDPKRRL